MLTVAVITLEKMALEILPDRGFLFSAALQLRICSDVCPADITIYNAACVLERLAFEEAGSWMMTPVNSVRSSPQI